jgi:hypothetical protein
VYTVLEKDGNVSVEGIPGKHPHQTAIGRYHMVYESILTAIALNLPDGRFASESDLELFAKSPSDQPCIAPRALKYPPTTLLLKASRVPASVPKRKECMTPR